MLYILYHISYSGPRQAPTDNGYKLQQKSGRPGTILQPLSSRLPIGRASDDQAERPGIV